MNTGYNSNQGSGSGPGSPIGAQKVIRFDKKYVQTLPGILKVVQLLCSLCSFIAIKISWGAWISAIFYNILYWVGIIVTGTLLLMYTFHFVEKYEHIPWLRIEFFYCGVMVLSYVILSILASTIGESVGIVVGLFGLGATVAYSMDGYLRYRTWKRGLPPQ